MSNKDKLYIDIAKACLSALNKASVDSKQEAYTKVYAAIDAAFNQQFEQLGTDYQKARSALESIAALTDTNTQSAPDIARNALSKPH